MKYVVTLVRTVVQEQAVLLEADSPEGIELLASALCSHFGTQRPYQWYTVSLREGAAKEIKEVPHAPASSCIDLKELT